MRISDWSSDVCSSDLAYFPDFLALLWPTLHAQIDWAHKPVFLDKELQRLAASSKHGRLHVDKLVRVRLLNGQDSLTLIHTEVQGEVRNHTDLQIGRESCRERGVSTCRYRWSPYL